MIRMSWPSQNLQMEIFTGPEKTQPVTDAKARNYFRLNYLYNLNIQTEGLEYLRKFFSGPVKISICKFWLRLFATCTYSSNSGEGGYGDNVKKVRELVEAAKLHLLDLSYSLDASLFSTPTTVTETSNSSGREKVADLLYAAIQEMSDLHVFLEFWRRIRLDIP